VDCLTLVALRALGLAAPAVRRGYVTTCELLQPMQFGNYVTTTDSGLSGHLP